MCLHDARAVVVLAPVPERSGLMVGRFRSDCRQNSNAFAVASLMSAVLQSPALRGEPFCNDAPYFGVDSHTDVRGAHLDVLDMRRTAVEARGPTHHAV